MAVDEAARLRLYDKARESWGDDEASTLMAALPRDPDRFATKDDIAVLGSELRGEIRASQAEIVRTLLFTIIASNATLVGLVLAAVRLG